MRLLGAIAIIPIIQGCDGDDGPYLAGTTDPAQYQAAAADVLADKLLEATTNVGSLGALAHSGGYALAAITDIGNIGGPLSTDVAYDGNWIIVGQVSGDPDGFSTSGSILLNADLATGTLTGLDPGRFEVDATFAENQLSGEVTYLGAVSAYGEMIGTIDYNGESGLYFPGAPADQLPSSIGDSGVIAVFAGSGFNSDFFTEPTFSFVFHAITGGFYGEAVPN
ncbi:MAG: hypothetical protein ACR2O1_13915 [Boseongicola sp.]